MEFKNEIIYITGAAGQIGSLLTRKFLEYGANVILVDNCIKNLEDYKKSLEYPESRFLISQIDIANQNEVKDSIQKGIEKFGKITMQVNNAGASIFSPWFATNPKIASGVNFIFGSPIKEILLTHSCDSVSSPKTVASGFWASAIVPLSSTLKS